MKTTIQAIVKQMIEHNTDNCEVVFEISGYDITVDVTIIKVEKDGKVLVDANNED